MPPTKPIAQLTHFQCPREGSKKKEKKCMQPNVCFKLRVYLHFWRAACTLCQLVLTRGNLQKTNRQRHIQTHTTLPSPKRSKLLRHY